MPHVSELRVTPDHAGHDRLLVAALAAGDLTGADRDHALELTRSCTSCAELHDDLVAIARATSVVAPPIARPRDFQLSPADAARLRPSGWRRALTGLAGARLVASRPLGVGLATLGLAGLLIGNVPIGSFGASGPTPAASSGAAAQPAAAGDQGTAAEPPASIDAIRGAPRPAASAAASAAGSEFGAVVGASPSSGASHTQAEYDASSAPALTSNGGAGGAAATDSSGTPKAADGAGTQTPATQSFEATQAPETNPLRPFNVVFALAVLVGLGLLVAARLRSRSAA